MRMIDATLRMIDQFTPTLRTAQTAIKASEAAMKTATTQTKVLSNATKTYSRSAAEMEKINQRTAKSLDGIGKSMSAVGKIAFVATLTGAATEGFKLAQSLDKIMARISMLGNVSPEELKKIRKAMMEVSNATGIAIETVADATKTAVESGIKATDALGYVQNAIKLSKVAGDELGTTMQQLTTFTKSYYLTVEDTARLSDQMVVTSRLAGYSLTATNAALSPIAKSAADAGISVQQMSAAFALMGAHKIPAEEAGVALRSMFDSFSKASPKAIKAAQEFGIELNRAHIQSVGFPAFLQEVMEKTSGNEQAISKIIPDLNTFKMALMMTSSDGMAEYNEYLDKISNSQGATAEALSKMKTPSAETVKAMVALRNAGIDLVDGLAPLFTRGADMIKMVTSAFNSLSDGQKNVVFNILQTIIVFGILSVTGGKVISMFSGVFGNVMKFATALEKAGGLIPLIITHLNSLISTFKLVGTAAKLLFANPIGLIILGVIAAIYLLYTNWDWLGEKLGGIWSGITEKFQSACDFIDGVLSSTRERIDNFLKSIADLIKSIPGVQSMLNTLHSFTQAEPTPAFASGVQNFHGGSAIINDAGPEIIELPTGTNVIPHDKSMRMEYERGKAENKKTSSIIINKMADTVIVREEADIDKIASKMAQKLESYAMNQAEGAV